MKGRWPGASACPTRVPAECSLPRMSPLEGAEQSRGSSVTWRSQQCWVAQLCSAGAGTTQDMSGGKWGH